MRRKEELNKNVLPFPAVLALQGSGWLVQRCKWVREARPGCLGSSCSWDGHCLPCAFEASSGSSREWLRRAVTALSLGCKATRLPVLTPSLAEWTPCILVHNHSAYGVLWIWIRQQETSKPVSPLLTCTLHYPQQTSLTKRKFKA